MKKNLDKAKLNELKKMIIEGKTSKEIADLFKISTATVNYHRAKLKRQGIKKPLKKDINPQIDQVSEDVNTIKLNEKKMKTSKNLKFIINGVQINISGKAKSVNISPEPFEIDF